MLSKLTPRPCLLPAAAAAWQDEMSRKGYRTLVMGERVVSAAEYKEWSAQWNAAQVAMDDREKKVAAASEAIERNLELVGATGVEDKLQDGVPECLQDLRKAGIKTWILTGDKVETAVSIAHNCKLFTDDMEVLQLVDADLNKEKDSTPKQALSKVRRRGEGGCSMAGVAGGRQGSSDRVQILRCAEVTPTRTGRVAACPSSFLQVSHGLLLAHAQAVDGSWHMHSGPVVHVAAGAGCFCVSAPGRHTQVRSRVG